MNYWEKCGQAESDKARGCREPELHVLRCSGREEGREKGQRGLGLPCKEEAAPELEPHGSRVPSMNFGIPNWPETLGTSQAGPAGTAQRLSQNHCGL